MKRRSGTAGQGRLVSKRVFLQVLWLVGVGVFSLLLMLPTVNAWEWSDWVSGGSSGPWNLLHSRREATTTTTTTTLSIQQVSDLRVRDIKRRLSRNHGYSATELGRILDKKELIQTLAFAEEKLRLSNETQAKRIVIQQTIIAAIVTLLLIFCWPLIQHAWEVASINLVVYTDRKRYEASRCWDLQCVKGMIGVVLMGILDILQVWLTASILLSWVTTSRYFFPVPNIPVRPAQFMGGEMAKSSVANYGINIGSMLVTWGMRFLYHRMEQWTGRALAAANRQTRRDARQRRQQTPSNNMDGGNDDKDREARKKAARRAAKLEKQQHAAASASLRPFATSQQQQQQSGAPPPQWMVPTTTTTMQGSSPSSTATVVNSRTHYDFLNELLDEHTKNASQEVGDEPTAFLDSSDDPASTPLDELD